MNVNAAGYGVAPIDTGVVTASGGSPWALIGIIQLGGNKRGALLQFTQTGGSLTHLKFTRTAIAGGTHLDWLVDTDLNTVDYDVIDVISNPAGTPPNIYQLASGNLSQVKLDKLEGVQEIAIWTQGAGSLRVQGTAY